MTKKVNDVLRQCTSPASPCGRLFPRSRSRSKRVLVALAVSFMCSQRVLATVTEPNGLVLPVDSMNGETQLYTLLMSRAEGTDWQGDAASTPNRFIVLPTFTATVVLQESTCNMDLVWYNETGQPPPANDLHVLIPAGSPNGTVSATDIGNDPNYLGGFIGFALRASGFCSQDHFMNPLWNPEYAPGVPWIAAVTLPSSLTQDAYYAAFESGPMIGTAFNNDGDFNDYVVFLTGLTTQTGAGTDGGAAVDAGGETGPDGGSDGGAESDAGDNPGADAGSDGGAASDAGDAPVPDAGSDGGGASDAGGTIETDAGSSSSPDAGDASVPDAGRSVDAAVVPVPDAGVAVDAGGIQSSDGGQRDAGAAQDGGSVSADAGGAGAEPPREGCGCGLNTGGNLTFASVAALMVAVRRSRRARRMRDATLHP